MKKYLILFLSLLILSSCNKQKANKDKEKATSNVTPTVSHQGPGLRADSLVSILSTLPDDTNKVNVYAEIYDYYIYSGSPSKAVPHIKQGIELSKNLNYNEVDILIAAGRVYWKLGENDTALKHHFDALKLTDKQKDPEKYTTILIYIGQDFGDGGNYPEALKYFLMASDLAIKRGDKNQEATINNLISWVYSVQGNYAGSSKYNMKSLRIFEETGDLLGQAVTLGNIGGDYRRLEKYDQAISYFNRALALEYKSGDYVNIAATHHELAGIYLTLHKHELAQIEINKAFEVSKKSEDYNLMGEGYRLLGDIEKLRKDYSKAAQNYLLAIDFYKKVNSLQEIVFAYNALAICYIRSDQNNLAKAALDSTEVYYKMLNSNELKVEYFYGIQLYDSLTENWQSAYRNYYAYINLRDSINSLDINKKILQNNVQYEFDKKEAAAKVEQEKKDIRQRNIRNIIIIMLCASLLFLVVVSIQRSKISKARKRSDELLLNILPEEVAEELKAKGSAAAKHFNVVTVMFTDFKGFTNIAEKLTPDELVNEIHSCFKEFDKITTKYGIEKIKTIGDAYMCAGGLPVENNTNPEDVIKAALEIQEFMQHHLDQRKKSGQEVFEIRIGIHTGPVVAGIVGIKKFAYDIWGDTVNIASRMESSGEAGKVNISGSTYELVKEKFNCIYRGKIQAKNKGEVDMYFVESIS